MRKRNALKHLERIASLMRIAFRQELVREGLQLVHLETLTYLDSCNKYSNSPQHVAAYLGLTKGTVSQSISLLNSLGLVEKNIDPIDRRKVNVLLTARGKQVVLKFEQLVKIDDLKDDFSEESRSLEDSLEALLLSLQKANGFKTFGACKTCIHHQINADGRMCLLTKQSLSEAEKELICHEHRPQVVL